MADVNKHRADIQASHSVMIWRRKDWYLNVDKDFLKKSAYADKLSSKFVISPVSLLCQIKHNMLAYDNIQVQITNGGVVPVSDTESVPFIKDAIWEVSVTDLTPEPKYDLLTFDDAAVFDDSLIEIDVRTELIDNGIPFPINEAFEEQNSDEYEP